MPMYRYDCARCGAFDEVRPMSAYAEPCPCPSCGVLAEREVAAASLARSGSSEGKRAFAAQRHQPGCGCCGTAARRGLRAEAASAAAPKNGSAPAGSFMTRA